MSRIEAMARRLHEIDVEHGISGTTWDRLDHDELETYRQDAIRLIDAYETATY